MFSLSIYSTEYELLENSEYINFYGKNVGSLNKNDVVNIKNFYIFTSEEKPFYYATFDEYFIPVKVLNNQDLDTKLPFDFISSCDTNGMFLYPYYIIEAVNKNNRNIIAQNDKKNTDIMTGNIDIEEYWYDYMVKPQLISNIGLVLGSAYGQYTLYVDDIKKNNTDEYILKIEVNAYIGRLKNPVFYDFKNEQELNLKLKKDGDYLYVFVENETTPREAYCYVNNDFRIAINELVSNNSCNNINLTWPRHADGTCDYEDVSSIKIDDNHLNYRAQGYGAHLQLYLTESSPDDFIDIMEFEKKKNEKTKDSKIQCADRNIVNPFDYTEKYEKDTKK